MQIWKEWYHLLLSFCGFLFLTATFLILTIFSNVLKVRWGLRCYVSSLSAHVYWRLYNACNDALAFQLSSMLTHLPPNCHPHWHQCFVFSVYPLNPKVNFSTNKQPCTHHSVCCDYIHYTLSLPLAVSDPFSINAAYPTCFLSNLPS